MIPSLLTRQMASEASVKALRRLRHQLSLLAGTPADDFDPAELSIQYTAAEDDSQNYKGMILVQRVSFKRVGVAKQELSSLNSVYFRCKR